MLVNEIEQLNKMTQNPVTVASHILRLQMEERPPMWRVAVYILNKQLCTADVLSSILGGFCKVLTTPRRKNWPFYETDSCWSAQTLKLERWGDL